MSVPDFNPSDPAFMREAREKSRATFRRLLAGNKLVVFAFATSSLRGVPIQVAAISSSGHVLHEVIGTAEPLDPDSQAFHGVRQAEVDAAPSLAITLPVLEKVLGEANEVITFTTTFMRDALVRGCKGARLEVFGTSHWLDGQDLLAPLCGTYNWSTVRWSRPKLTDCIRDLDVPADFAAIGTALGNAQRLHRLIEHFALEPEAAPPVGVCERCGLGEDCTCGVELDEGDTLDSGHV